MKNISNLFRRRKYAGGEPKTVSGLFDLLMNDQIRALEEAFEEKRKRQKFYMNMMQGKTESMFIKELVRCFIPCQGMLQPAFASAISGLLKLLLKDKYRLYEDADELLHSDVFYGENYNRYLASRIKKITESREPGFDDFRKDLDQE